MVVAVIDCSVTHYLNFEFARPNRFCDEPAHGCKHILSIYLISDIHPSIHI